MPPPPSASLSNVSSPLTSKSTEECEIVDKEESLKTAWENLQNVTKEDLDPSRLEDVQKRLDLMRSLWLEDKLNGSIHLQILKLSEGNCYCQKVCNFIEIANL